MSKHTNRNIEALTKALKGKESGSSTTTVIAVKELADEVYDWAQSMASSEKYSSRGTPVFTGNLLDSFGIGIYLNGTLVAVSMEGQRYATDSQTINGKEYWGRDKLELALSQTSNIGSGLVMRIFSASPISEMINDEGSPIGRGRSFFDDIIDMAKILALEKFGIK